MRGFGSTGSGTVAAGLAAGVAGAPWAKAVAVAKSSEGKTVRMNVAPAMRGIFIANKQLTGLVGEAAAHLFESDGGFRVESRAFEVGVKTVAELPGNRAVVKIGREVYSANARKSDHLDFPGANYSFNMLVFND